MIEIIRIRFKSDNTIKSKAMKYIITKNIAQL